MAQNSEYPNAYHQNNVLQTSGERVYHKALRTILAPLLFVWFAFVCAETYSIFTTQQTFSLNVFYYLLHGLPTGIDLLILVLTFLFSTIGPGYLILKAVRLPWRDRWEQSLFSLAMGLIFYTFLFLAIGSLGLLHLWVCYLIFGAGLTVSGIYAILPALTRQYACRRRGPSMPTPRYETSWTTIAQIWLTLLLLLFFYIALLGALSPETEFDGRWYHLGPARAYAREDDFINYVQETNMRAAALDVYQVVLYTVLWKFDGMIAAKMVHWGYALLTGLGIIYFCKSFLKSSLTGLLGALIYISTPLISWSAGTGGNDLQLCFYTLLGVYAFLRWQESMTQPRWLILAGLMTGFALGSKWQGISTVLLVIAAIGLLSIIHFCRSVKGRNFPRHVLPPLALYAVSTFIACAPWLLRAYYMTGNPLFPFFNSLFHSPYTLGGSPSGQPSQRFGGEALFTTVIDSLTLHSQYRALLGPIFIFIMPISLLSLLFLVANERTVVRLLSAFVFAWLVLWYAIANFELRYIEAVIPIMALIAAHATVGAHWRLWRGRMVQSALCMMISIFLVSNFYSFVPFQNGAGVANAFAQPRISWAYLYEGAPEESVQLQYIPMITYINQHLSPEQDKIYDTSGLILYASYSDVLFYSGTKSIDGSTKWDLSTPNAIAQLSDIGATYVSMTSASAEQIKQRPINKCLKPIYQTPDDQLLFQVEYARVLDNTTSTCR